MTILYNCRHSGDQYRITKFDSDMNPQGSYLLSLEECECPAGVRPTCRHRQMLPKFIARSHVGDEWFFDFDRGGWVQMGDEWVQQDGFSIEMQTALEADGEKLRQLTGEDHGPYFPNLPEGVTAIVMDHPDKVVDVHNAIAEAVGEPEVIDSLTTMSTAIEKALNETGYVKEPPSPTHIPRRF